MPRKGPDARDKAIGSRLKQQRMGTGKKQAEVAAALDWPASKLSRIEAGIKRIEVEDAAAILAVLGVGGEEFDRIIEQIKQPRTSGWWERGLPGVPTEAGTLAAYEEDAVVLTDWAPLLVPGLLQTDAYAREFMRQSGVPPHDISARVMVRAARQRKLDVPGVRYTAVFGEAAFKTRFGSTEDHRSQLIRIREVADKHRVLVVPEYTATPALLSAWLLMEYAADSGMGPVAHGELASSAIFFVHEEADPYLQQRDVVLGLALDASESRTLLDRAIAELK